MHTGTGKKKKKKKTEKSFFFSSSSSLGNVSLVDLCDLLESLIVRIVE
jgi:hypothetical protein